MKKILFASTALVAAGLLTTGSAEASEKIKLSLGGFSKWWVVGTWQDQGYQDAKTVNNALGGGQGSLATGSTIGANYTNVDIKGDNEVWFGGSTTLDNGIKVGVDIHLEAGGHTDATTDTIDKSYVFVEGGFGKFIVGKQKNGTYLLHVTAPDAAGNWNEGGIMTANYAIAKPTGVNLMAGGNTTAIRTTDNATSFTYVAPTFYGLTVGASFLPYGYEATRGVVDLNSIANVVATTGAAVNAAVRQVYGAGALYANTFGAVGVKVSAGAVYGDAAPGTAVSWFEQAYGTQISYAGFTLGGSYRHQQANYKGGQGTTVTDLALAATTGATYQTDGGNGSLSNGGAFDVGLQYATGPYAISFAYFRSAVAHQILSTVTTGGNGNDIAEFYQLSGKYALGAGVDILASAGYASYSSAVTKSSTTGISSGDTLHNSGWTVMSGISLAF